MGLLRKINDALATVRESQVLAAKYAAQARRHAAKANLIDLGRHAENEQTKLAA